MISYKTSLRIFFKKYHNHNRYLFWLKYYETRIQQEEIWKIGKHVKTKQYTLDQPMGPRRNQKGI